MLSVHALGGILTLPYKIFRNSVFTPRSLFVCVRKFLCEHMYGFKKYIINKMPTSGSHIFI